ncbi:MAG: glycosyltransferase family 39 protein, partial [Chloroflexi bacterium]|nr:glycosyltransferase family 39 protein [Chloroflexota bacterium]
MSVLRMQAVRRARIGIAVSASHPIFWPAFALLGIYVVSYVAFAGQLIAFPFDLDQGEGYDAWSGWLINLGRLPYTDNAVFPYYSHGYPPVWSYLVSIPMAWTGPGVGPARAVSALATLGSALLIGRATGRASRSTWIGLLAAGLFLSSPYVFHTTPLARVNALMVLLDLLALSLFAEPTPRRAVLGAVVLALAVFTKPTAIDAVVAGLLFLLLVDARLAVLAGAVFGCVAGLGLLAL